MASGEPLMTIFERLSRLYILRLVEKAIHMGQLQTGRIVPDFLAELANRQFSPISVSYRREYAIEVGNVTELLPSPLRCISRFLWVEGLDLLGAHN